MPKVERRRGDHEVVYVVSIRRASRPPLDDTDYMLRFLHEAAGIGSGPMSTQPR